MTDVSEIADFQRKFDDAHGWRWTSEPAKKLERLQEGVVCLTGEVGEFANVLKKIVRHNERGPVPAELWPALNEELVDVFIYLIKLADLLGVELDKGYFDKMALNAKRFQQFEVNGGK